MINSDSELAKNIMDHLETIILEKIERDIESSLEFSEGMDKEIKRKYLESKINGRQIMIVSRSLIVDMLKILRELDEDTDLEDLKNALNQNLNKFERHLKLH